MKETKSHPIGVAVLSIFFIILCILFLIPLYALVLGTFKGGAELFVSGLNLNPTPSLLHLKAWRYLFTGIMSNGELNPHDYFLWYRNSLMVVLVQGSLTLLLSSMVAYGLAKYKFKGQNVIFMCVLMVMMVPLEILMLPMYTQVNAMGLRNSYAGVMLPFLVSMSAVFFFRQFLTNIPYEMIEAARVDGCTEYGIFFRIIMPVMKPEWMPKAKMRPAIALRTTSDQMFSPTSAVSGACSTAYTKSKAEPKGVAAKRRRSTMPRATTMKPGMSATNELETKGGVPSGILMTMFLSTTNLYTCTVRMAMMMPMIMPWVPR
jgi:arabinosaccharide transport system permease protein